MSLITKKDFEPMIESEELEVLKMLKKARVQMLIAFPFFGILAMYLNFEVTYDLTTAGTDGEMFYYNPYFIKSLTEEEQNWLVVHEVMHAALKHIWRQANRNPKMWNCACDYAIHSVMHQFVNECHSEYKNKLRMPQVKVYNRKTKQYENKINVLYDPKYDNMSADEIYAILRDRKQKKGKKEKRKPFHWFGINVESDGTISMLLNNAYIENSLSTIRVGEFNTATIKYDGLNMNLYLNGSLACSQKIEPLEGETFSIQSVNETNMTAFEGYLKNIVIQKPTTGNKIVNYTLNNTVADTTWNNENITLINAPFQSNGSVYSNGLFPKDNPSASVILTPNIRSFDIEDFSISIDFQIDSIPSSRMPVIIGNIHKNEDSGGSDGDDELETLDDHDMWNKPKAQDKAQQKVQDWEGRLVEAAQVAEHRRAGSVAGYMKRLIGNIVAPQKDWRVLLNEFVQPEIDDYSFNPPDRRFQDNDFFLPDLNDTVDVVKKIIFEVDTSGSIQEPELLASYSEIVGACNQFSGKLSGWIGFFDHVAYGLHSFENVTEVLNIKPEGGGGTSFYAPFEYINEYCKDDDIAGIIILTDGFADWPKESIANGVPVLWLINNEEVKPPWGLYTTIKIK